MSGSRLRLWVTVAIGLITLTTIGLAIHQSRDPDLYHRNSHIEDPPWSHPTAHVAFFCVAILLEGIVAALILVGPWPRRLWSRGLLGAPILVAWGQLSTLYVVHMPGYVLVHHLWIWILSFLVGAVAFLSLVDLVGRRLYLFWKGAGSDGSTAPQA